MEKTQYEKVCYTTDKQEESVALKNLKTGEIGFTYGCTFAGTTIQVRLENGDLDSWDKEDCVPETDETKLRPHSTQEIKP